MKHCRLLVVGPSWVGDMVMAQSLFKSLKFDNPDLVIDVLAPEWSSPITERMPEVNKTIVSDLKHGEIGISKRYNLAKRLKENQYNQAIILPRSIKSALIPWLASIPVRTGFKGEMRYRLINDMRQLDPVILNQTVKRFVALGIEKDRVLPVINYPKLKVLENNKSNIINRLDIDPGKPAIGILPGAEYGPAKRWPPNYFSQVIEEYLVKDWSVFILGSLKEQEISQDIYAQLLETEYPNLYDLTGHTSLLDAVDILSMMDIVLTNDSGLMHIAAAVGTPLVALYGPSSPDFTPPLTDNAKIIRKTTGYSKVRRGDAKGGYHPSLIALKPSEVLRELNILIEKSEK
ncbi:MAG: lipopolysaccharide heptosyltransferase II [Pseudomonadota bacterium]|nr:lipopolysaccharide heptosyltransferase II [Pseudomonadota bacterium]